MLALPPIDPKLKEPIIYNSISIITRKIEPAGRNF